MDANPESQQPDVNAGPSTARDNNDEEFNADEGLFFIVIVIHISF